MWLALEMKKNRQCKIRAPDWLTVGPSGLPHRFVLWPYSFSIRTLRVLKICRGRRNFTLGGSSGERRSPCSCQSITILLDGNCNSIFRFVRALQPAQSSASHWYSFCFPSSAASDLMQPSEVRRLVESIWMNKTSRMRKNIIRVAQTPTTIASINFSGEGLGSMEINTILPIFVETMNQIRHLEEDGAPPVRGAAAKRRQTGSGR